MPVPAASHHHPPSCVTCSLLAPCRRALTRLFRVPASTALSIRAFRFRSLRNAAARMSPQRRRRRRRLITFRSVRAVFWPLVPPPSSTPADEAARGSAATTELLAAAAAAAAREVPAPVPSPETPAYVKVVARLRSGRSAASGDGDDEEEEGKEAACRSFESCLMEMLVEEGKAGDLQDVEELLRCWDRLKSPVFVDLVCRFYGELCNDMFPATSTGDDDDDDDDAGRDGDDAPALSKSGA